MWWIYYWLHKLSGSRLYWSCLMGQNCDPGLSVIMFLIKCNRNDLNCIISAFKTKLNTVKPWFTGSCSVLPREPTNWGLNIVLLYFKSLPSSKRVARLSSASTRVISWELLSRSLYVRGLTVYTVTIRKTRRATITSIHHLHVSVRKLSSNT